MAASGLALLGSHPFWCKNGATPFFVTLRFYVNVEHENELNDCHLKLNLLVFTVPVLCTDLLLAEVPQQDQARMWVSRLLLNYALDTKIPTSSMDLPCRLPGLHVGQHLGAAALLFLHYSRSTGPMFSILPEEVS